MKEFDVIIVGAGSVGVGLFRDLALHGLSCLLLDRGDFSSQTSQTSSKMLHGGIRYLENCDFGLVREALYEKNLWIRMAPHVAHEIPFYLPIYKESKYPLWMTSIGLKMYDLLSGFQNKPHYILNKKKTVTALPGLLAQGLRGAGVYHDAVVDDHKLILECIYDALKEPRAVALNYSRVENVEVYEGGATIKVYDELTQNRSLFKGKQLIFATGPFTDQLLIQLGLKDWKPQLLLSKGAHLWIDPEKFPMKEAMVLQTNDRRIIFVIPQKRGVLVGTTETPVQEEIFNIKASDQDLHYLLQNINHYFPHAKIEEKDVLSSFAGVRPLVRKGNISANKASRVHKVYHYRPHVHVIIGGKYTTFRVMGQDLCRKIVREFGRVYDAKKTLAPLRQRSMVIDFEKGCLTPSALDQILKKELPRTFADLIYRRLNIPGKNHWKEETPFDQYFLQLLPELEKHIKISSKEIENLS